MTKKNRSHAFGIWMFFFTLFVVLTLIVGVLLSDSLALLSGFTGYLKDNLGFPAVDGTASGWSLIGTVAVVIYFFSFGVRGFETDTMVKATRTDNRRFAFKLMFSLFCFMLLVNVIVLSLLPLNSSNVKNAALFAGESGVLALIVTLIVFLIFAIIFFVVAACKKNAARKAKAKALKKAEAATSEIEAKPAEAVSRTMEDIEKEEAIDSAAPSVTEVSVVNGEAVIDEGLGKAEDSVAADEAIDSTPEPEPAPAEEPAPEKQLADGIYLETPDHRFIALNIHSSPYFSDPEYGFSGKLGHGIYRVVVVTDGAVEEAPYSKVAYDVGYTLEGAADSIFAVDHSLRCYSEEEKRSFNYTNGDSLLRFHGDENRDYTIWVRIYDNTSNRRWCVIYAE